MVRTYAFNASSRSEIFEQYKHTAAAPRFNPNPSPENYNALKSQNTVSTNYSNDNRTYAPSESLTTSTATTNSLSPSSNSSHMSHQENNNQFMSNYFPPLNQSHIYQSSFHQSMMDPVGSIIGLRLLYMNGQLVYVPVEPHINMMINKQFGVPGQPDGQPPVILPQIQNNVPIMAQNAAQPMFNSYPTANPPIRSQSRDDVNQNRQDPYNQPPPMNARQSANQQYRQNTMHAKYGSLPNLAQKQLSSQEQHKLELQQQIEDNKRRRELEKQKEFELEQREIRKWEEYQKRIRDEDEREKRQIQEKARAIEARNQHVYEHQQNDSRNRRKERRPSIPQQKAPPQNYHQQYNNYDSYPENEEPIRPTQKMRNSNSFSDDYSQQRPNSRPIRNQPPRFEQQQEMTRERRPDSSQPRQVEWWEKKPSWQDRASERQSAVIPTLRGKPPAVPDSQRSGYDSSGHVGEHQSRPSSRTTSSSQRSSDGPPEEPIERNPSGTRKAPTAFTITA